MTIAKLFPVALIVLDMAAAAAYASGGDWRRGRLLVFGRRVDCKRNVLGGIMSEFKYQVSTDYKRLWELGQAGETIICFVDYNPLETGMDRVSAEVNFTEGYYIIATPGICHSIGKTIEKFIARCKAMNLGFIDPSIQQRTAKETAAEEMYAALEKIAEYGDCFGYKVGERNPYKMVIDALKKARG